MALYALLNNGVVESYREFAEVPTNPIGKPYLTWLPVVDVNPEVTDAETQTKDGPVVTIGATEVTRTWTVRAKTAPELSTEREGLLDGVSKRDMKLYRAFDDRLRTLEGQAVRTGVQFRQYWKGLL